MAVIADYILVIFLFVIRFSVDNSIINVISASYLLKTQVTFIYFTYSWYDYIKNIGDYKVIRKYQNENGCFKAAKPLGEIKGIIIRCTEPDSPYLKRYVDDHNELGYNQEQNHWNTSSNNKMPHYFIGYDKNSNITIVNTLPLGCSSLACGKGVNGSYDLYPNGHIQIQICRPITDDKNYFEHAVLGATVQLCVFLCHENHIKAEAIISDEETYAFGYASNKSDFERWLKNNLYTMDSFRRKVKDRQRPIMLFSKG